MPQPMRSPVADYPIAPVPFTAVKVDDPFWSPRIETNRAVTIPYDFRKCEETGRIHNFVRAARGEQGEFNGIRFDDSDVFKTIEAAACSLAVRPDPKLDAYLDGVIAKIAAAQEPDGYLFTIRRIVPADQIEKKDAGRERWSQLKDSHELYNVGHLYEAAVAHFYATGKRSLLDVALKNAALVDRVFGPGRRRDVPGHQEIELGLVKLFRATGERRWLDLAKFFLDERGKSDGHKLYGQYNQDHQPVVEQSEAVGHAVRAGYMYAGMADVAALTGDRAFIAALDRIWENVVSKKLHVTGGIGARHEGEAFGDAYELPNARAYNETCAAIANVYWNQRMFLLHGDAKYIDVLERTLYNGFLSGVALSGDEFFYPNPLASDGKTPFNHGTVLRQPWFHCSCCPPNVARLLPSLGGYVYAVRGTDAYVNLFVSGSAPLNVGGNEVRLTQSTRYPWDGRVSIAVDPHREAEFSLMIRIPGWATGRPVPSDLYRYRSLPQSSVRLTVNGQAMNAEARNGYAAARRTWRKGDRVEVELPMPIRVVEAHSNVADDRGLIALERGPIVYCAEAIDFGGSLAGVKIPDPASLIAEHRPDLLGGVTVLRSAGGTFTAVPYYAWAHRGAGAMAVWLPPA